MQSINLANPAMRSVPLEQVFTKPAVDYFSTLIIAGETSPNNDWGATDLAAAAAAGVTNAGVQCASKCASMPWLYTGCQRTPINAQLVGGIADPCTGLYPTSAQQFPALTATPRGRALLQFPYTK